MTEPDFVERALGRRATEDVIDRMKAQGATFLEAELVLGEPSGTVEVRGWKVRPDDY